MQHQQQQYQNKHHCNAFEVCKQWRQLAAIYWNAWNKMCVKINICAHESKF